MEKKLIFGAVLCVCVPLVLSVSDLWDSQLNVVDRSPAEAAQIATITAPTAEFTKPKTFGTNSAAAAPVRVIRTADAFGAPSANIDFARELEFKLGNGLFRMLWVAFASSTLRRTGWVGFILRGPASADI